MKWHLFLAPVIYIGIILLMKHRHLRHEEYTLAAIDDIIDRGGRGDWAELRSAAISDQSVLKKISSVCMPRINNPHAQRHHLWSQYAKRHVA